MTVFLAILNALKAIGSVFSWFSSEKDRQIGQTEQQNADLEKTYKTLKDELAAANNSTSAADGLRSGKF